MNASKPLTQSSTLYVPTNDQKAIILEGEQESRSQSVGKNASCPSASLAAESHKMTDYQRCEQVPDELKKLIQWVLWKYETHKGKPTKVPYQVNSPTCKASSTNPKTWSSFNKACFVKEQRDFDGIGFVLCKEEKSSSDSANNFVIGIDIDHIVEKPGDPIPQDVMEELKLLDTYCELSPSGTGIHAFIRGSLPFNGKKKGIHEMYSTGRYLTCTGNKIPEFPSIVRENQKAIDILIEKWFIDSIPEKAPIVKHSTKLMDETILELGSNARNAKKFLDLYEGSKESWGYSSQSEADLALCNLLAFYTQDFMQIDRIFRSSGLFREKWDKKRGSKTYGELTIEKALSSVSETYSSRKEKIPEITEVELEKIKKANRHKSDPPLEITLKNNLIADYVRHQNENQLSYFDFHFMSFIALVSALSLGHVSIRWLHAEIRPVVWALLIGNPGSSKKSTAVKQVVELLSKIDLKFKLQMKFPGSVEAFIEDLEGKERTNNDSALLGKGLLIIDESSRIFAKYREARYSGLVEEMNKAFDSSYIGYGTRTKSLRIEISDPFMPLLFATTPRGIGKLAYADVGSGHLTRYLFAIPLRDPPKEKSKRWRAENLENTKVLDYICDELRRRYEIFQQSQVYLKMSDIDHEWYLNWEDGIDEVIKNSKTRLPEDEGFADRLKTMAQRLAILYHICRSDFCVQVFAQPPNEAAIMGAPPTKKSYNLMLDSDCLHEACNHIEKYFVPMIYRFIELIEQDDSSPLTKVRRIIKDSVVISRTNLIRACGSIEAEKLTKLVHTLDESDEIEIRKITTSGRDRSEYIWRGG